MFRAYDIRGSVEQLTADLVTQIARALASQYHNAGQKQVVLGYDARLTSADYAQRMAQGLAQSGIDVIFIGQVSTPLLYFSAKQHAGNGIMLTASHNPASDNGIKWMIQACAPTPAQIQAIADCVEQQNFYTAPAQIHQLHALPAYLDYLATDIAMPYPLKVCVDGMHGSAGYIAEAALQRLGCEVVALHCQANGAFPLGAPDPSDPARLAQLQQLVVAHQACLGIALDGDGDRLVLIDDQGQYINPDRLLCLLAKICLVEQAGQQIVCDVKCSSMVADTVAKYHGHLAMIRTGSSFLRNYLQQHRAVFGGEFAGHFVFNDGRGRGYDDGLYAALRVLEYLAQQQQSLSQAMAEFPQRVGSKDIYIPAVAEDLPHLLDTLEQRAIRLKLKINKVDGIRLDFPFGFGIIRASNTGEFFTVRFDADSDTHLQQIRQIFVEAALQAEFPQIAHVLALAD